MSVKLRFAPSPTGYLHVGNLRLALINWLYAKANNGTLVLRLDDTDEERSTDEYAAAIQEDLTWLQLPWDQLEKQSDRLAEYDKAFAQLKADGKLYPCYETAEEIEYKRKRLLARKLPPVYDRAALDLSDDAKAGFELLRRRPHWRFKLDQEMVAWDDLVRGHVEVDCASMSDPVLIRSDGRPLYHLPSVVDDIDFAITHVIRGEDHVSNTALHIQLFKALGADVPGFAHLPLLMGPDGGPLSKREGSQSLREMKQNGIEPLALNSLMARLGTSDNVELRHSMADITTGFDIGHFSRAAAKFDPAELANLNAKLIHVMTWAEVSSRPELEGMSEAFWNVIHGNLSKLGDAKDWWRVVTGPIDPVVEDAGFLAKAAELLPEGELDGDSWKSWTDAIKEATGAKGKALFMPLRLALTAQPHGPEMKAMLPLIGRARIIARLGGDSA